MTTIAYKDGVVAFDTLVTKNTTVAGYDNNKAMKFTFDKHEFIVGAAGTAASCEKLFTWAETNFAPDKRPQEESLENIDAFIIYDNNKKYLMNGNFVIFEIKTDVLALGSGNELALGAMLNGASAVEALKIAAKLDVYTGGRIKQLRFKEK